MEVSLRFSSLTIIQRRHSGRFRFNKTLSFKPDLFLVLTEQELHSVESVELY